MSRGKVVVTGAGGFVCSEIICALARAGFEPDWLLTDLFKRLSPSGSPACAA